MPDLTTHSGYMDRFWEHVSEHPEKRDPMKYALICVESELRSSHGVQRYSSYRSFSTVKGRKRSRPFQPSFKTVQL